MLAVGVTTALLVWLQVPAAPIFGGLVGGVVHALRHEHPVVVPEWSFRVGQAIVGAGVGAAIVWGDLVDLGSAWPAVGLVVVVTLVVSVAAGQVLRLHRGVDLATATFASIAGGASGMAAMARDAGADERIVTVVQYLRVLVILATIPFAVAVLAPVSGGGSAPGTDPVGWPGYVLAAAAVVVGILLGRLLRLPSPAVLGSLVAAALLVQVPALEGATVPPVVQAAGFVLIGVQVGLRFTRATLLQLGRMMPTALVVIVLVVVMCAGLGVVLSELAGVSRVDGYLATTPGGLPAVLAATSSSGADLSFVSAVQVLRLLLVLAVAPFVGRWLLRRRG